MRAPHQNVTFEQLIRKVRHAEDLLEARERSVAASYRRLAATWREGWTPWRIVAAGMVSGFLVGRAEPLGAVGGARWLQMISAVSGLFASAQASMAAQEAGNAAADAEQAADAADPGASARADAASGAVAQKEANQQTRAPMAAEAASELSER
jgi:hypothetical protein